MSVYYDRDGNPIEQDEAMRLFGEDRHVALTRMGDWEVSTVHLVIDHSFRWDGGRPVIFETMIFEGGDYFDLYQERYSTEAEALAGHALAEAWLRAHLGGVTDLTQVINWAKSQVIDSAKGDEAHE